MGYCTYFTITSKPIFKGEKLDKLCEELEEISGGYGFEEYSQGTFGPGDSIKWYSIHDDMLKLSRQYPQHLFIVDGDGEESGDIWRCFFKNGKKDEHTPEIILPDEPTWK